MLDEGAALARLRLQREVVIVDAHHRHARSLLAHLRGDRDLCDLPVFALTRGADLKDFVRPLSWGADKVLTPASLSKLEGLLALATRVTPREPAGVATLTFTSEGRRRLHAGVLRTQGYRGQLCASVDELRFCLDDPSSQVFVVEASRLASPAVLRALRARDPLGRPWTVVVSDADGEAWRDLSDEGTALVPDSAPISVVLHRALQVRAASSFDLRATPRLHHESVARDTADGVTVAGLSFNIARDGLYVRAATGSTFAPRRRPRGAPR